MLMNPPVCQAFRSSRATGLLPRAIRASGGSAPWSTALRIICISGSASSSTMLRSSSVSSPASSRLACLPDFRARSRTRRAMRPNNWLIGDHAHGHGDTLHVGGNARQLPQIARRSGDCEWRPYPGSCRIERLSDDQLTHHLHQVVELAGVDFDGARPDRSPVLRGVGGRGSARRPRPAGSARSFCESAGVIALRNTGNLVPDARRPAAPASEAGSTPVSTPEQTLSSCGRRSGE